MLGIIIALGGNVLGNTPKEQQERIDNAALALIGLIKQEHGIVISHGNGFQVGMLHQALDTVSAANEEVPVFELPECTVMSQGYTGFHLQKGTKKESCREGVSWHVATMVTQIVVGKGDPAFLNPAKPTDSSCTAEETLRMVRENPKLRMREDAGRGYRQMVVSPRPADTAERDSILDLLDHKLIAIVCRGGGIPVVLNENGDYENISAVIDKDSVSAELAELVDANYLSILTAADRVVVNYGRPEQWELKEITVEETGDLCREDYFAPGNMLPKVGAAAEFTRSKKGRSAVIPSLEKVPLAMIGENGTRITL